MTEVELLAQVSSQLDDATRLAFNLGLALVFALGWIAGHQR